MVGEWIWQRNKDQRHFFVEESFPMEWSYPNAVPHGLCYEIKKDPVPVLTSEQVEGDMKYWREYIDYLKNDPRFENDIDAQRSFSKLRNTGGNIYKWRKMPEAAEKAYRQALELWPGNTETLNNFTDLLMKQNRTPELKEILARALKADPNNGLLATLFANCEKQIALEKEIGGLEQQWKESSKDPELFKQLLVKYSAEGNREKADPFVVLGASLFSTNSEVLRLIVNYYAIQGRVPEAVACGRKLEKIAPDDADLKFGMAKFYMAIGNKSEFYRYLKDAIRFGGLPMREKIAADSMFQKIQGESEFQTSLRPSPKGQ
jgi:tetratricopeptide (TPR) repeat protein